MKNHYFIEMTDTFGGDANYCWVNRFIVSASTPRGAMRRVYCRIYSNIGTLFIGRKYDGTSIVDIEKD